MRINSVTKKRHVRCHLQRGVAFLLLGIASLASANPSIEEISARFERDGVFDPSLISERDLFTHVQAMYAQETNPDRQALLAKRLLALKWMTLWDANAEMAAETAIVSDPLPPYFHPSDNWLWSSPLTNPATGNAMRLHYADNIQGMASHRANGVFPAILPVNGSLVQEIYVPEEQRPTQVAIRIETAYVGAPRSETITVQARWMPQPETKLTTNNRPDDFYAGELPQKSGWHALEVKLVDLGLCGTERIISNIEFSATGGSVWFGRTLIRRPPVEVRGAQKYHVFAPQDPFSFDISVHNFSASAKTYQLDLLASDYEGHALLRDTLAFSLPAHDTRTQPVAISLNHARYAVIEYTLREQETPVYHGYSAAAIIVPNASGRKPDSPFGMMYWDQPGREMAEFYQKLGVKLVVIFPELERLHLFSSGAFDVMPMIWTLPQGKPDENEKLRQQIQPYLQAGQQVFSNFWETDLRVPSQMFAASMRRFTDIIKQAAPNAKTVVGGMAWFNVAYVQQLLQAIGSGTPYFDAVTAMSYNTPTPPEYAGLDEDAAALRALFAAYGVPQTELWNVEWAYFENLNVDRGEWQDTGVAQEQTAAYTIRHHFVGLASGINRMIPGTNIYAGRTPLSKNYGHSMSLGRSSMFRYDLTPMPLLPAYATMTRMLEDRQFVTTLESGDANLFCHVYRRKQSQGEGDMLLVAWTVFGHQNAALRLPVGDRANAAPIQAFNMLGEERLLHLCNGEAQLNLSPEPQYLLLPTMTDEEMAQLRLSGGETLLSVEPQMLEVAPSANTATLTYHLHNAGDSALRGELRLTQPDGVEIVSRKIQYHEPMGSLLAKQMQLEEHEVLLSRQRGADVTYEISLPATMSRNAYYEQNESGRPPAVNVVAEFVAQDRALASATASVRALPPLDVRLRPVLKSAAAAESPTLRVQMTNHSSARREGEVWLNPSGWVQIAPSKQAFSLEPGASGAYDFTLTGMPEQTREYLLETVDANLQRLSLPVKLQEGEPMRLTHYLQHSGYLVTFGVGEGYVVEAFAREKSGIEARQSRGFAFRPTVKTGAPLVIDGDLSDWRNAVPLFVNPVNRLNGLTFFAKDYGGTMQWTSLDDFSSAWEMMWDDEWLYVATRLFDDHVVPQQALGAFWNGDVFSLQIDPLPDSADASPLPIPRDLRDVHTFDIGMNAAGPVVRRKHAARSHPAGNVSAIRIAARPMPDGVQYELAIPWTELDPLRPAPSGWFGCSFAWYEDDGSGRETFINWFGGSGGSGLAREPRLFGDVHFVEELSAP